MRAFITLLLSFFFPISLHAQWHSVGTVDSLTTGGGRQVTLHAGTSLMQVRVLSDDIVRVRFAPTGVFLPDSSWAVIKTNWPAIPVTIADHPSEITLTTKELTVRIEKQPLRVSFLDRSGRLINRDEPSKGISWCGSEVRNWKAMPEQEYYFGFGEKAGTFERKNTHMTMWNSDIPAYGSDTDPLYQTIPFFYGMNNGKAYGIFFDNSYRTSFDMGKESRDQYSFGAEGGELNYYLFAGPSPRKVLSSFIELVGRMSLPPRWSLGYQQCRWSYAPESRVREVAKNFREKRIPCDVIYLDIDYMDGYRIFTWNHKNFPDPRKMIGDLAREGFRIAVIVDPGIKADSSYSAFRTGLADNDFVRYPDGNLFIGKVWPGECAFPDFTSARARRWWGGEFAGLAAAGVRGWWNDMNEPSVFDVPTKTIDLRVIHDDNGLKTPHARNHNIYGMQMTRATFDGVRSLLPDERPFVLTRATYAGGHRYSAAWTGDNVASWEHLAMALSMCLNLSVSGQPFVGSDIGGFIGYPSGELFARWLQLGVFTPLMRAHSVINEKNKEPWEYGEEFTAINRETINLRYRMLPYIYTVMHDASVTGIPAMRPMVFAYPESENFVRNGTEFMFGDNLLIAPVLWPGVTQRDVPLPAGSWYDFWTGRRFEGGKQVTVDAPLGRIPVFVKAGSVIPTQQVVQYSEQAPIDPLTLNVYPPVPGEEYASSYYEDDGKSFKYQTGEYLQRTMTVIRTPDAVTLKLSASTGTYVPTGRGLMVQLYASPSSPKAVRMDGKELRRFTTGNRQSARNVWTYDSTTGSVGIACDDVRTAREFVVEY